MRHYCNGSLFIQFGYFVLHMLPGFVFTEDDPVPAVPVNHTVCDLPTCPLLRSLTGDTLCAIGTCNARLYRD